MVSSSSLPDRPSRRDSSTFGGGAASDTISASDLRSFRMRPALEPVKLRIANVCQSAFSNPGRAHQGRIERDRRHPENTAKPALFKAIAPFRTAPGTRQGNIDENRSLPYKPRQLSAIARSDRGGSFGPETVHVWGRHLTDLSHYQANFARSAENDP